MMYAVPSYVAGEGEMTADIAQLMRWAGFVLTLPMLAYSAAPFFAGAVRDLRRGSAGMDVPVAIGIAAAFAGSALATFSGVGDVYYDSIAMFVFLLLAARYLELVARSKAGDALLHLARATPRTARRLLAGAIEEIPAGRLAAGDRVLVRPGETVPADGALEDDSAHVSEAWLSGESHPVTRARGERMLEGAVNAGNAFMMRVERVGEATALSSIHRMMERALGERPRWVESAHRAAGLFAVAVLLAAAMAGLAWLWIDAARAPWVAVAVLVVTCPCALALATPLAVTAASGALARVNLVVSRASAIEALAGVTDVVLDKTGTLTEGRPAILQTVTFGERDAAGCIALAGTLARFSAHPLDRAFTAAAHPGDAPVPDGLRNVPGAGIEANIDGLRVRLGSAAYVQSLHGDIAPIAWIRTSDTAMFLGDECGWIAGFRLGDAIRPEARAALASLRALGLRLHLLSGDSRMVAEAVARDLGIEAVAAPADPAAKLGYVQALQACDARVAMVGDGINDAPVLAQADVSIAMGGGCDLAQIRADAVLLSDSLHDLGRAIGIPRKARRVVRQNLAWALGYNVIAIPVAVLGAVTPLLAGIGMSASSLLVVANALRLRHQGTISPVD
jgi:Cu2+-exporting ATPase